jgi:SAM-dependent methyltransferase
VPSNSGIHSIYESGQPVPGKKAKLAVLKYNHLWPNFGTPAGDHGDFPVSSPRFEKENLVQAPVSALPQSEDPEEYRRLIREQYDGLPGRLTAFTGWITGHELLAGRLFGPQAFDVRGCKKILEAGCGNGRYTRFLLEQADPGAAVIAFDYSLSMLRRSQDRLGDERVYRNAADLTRLPYGNDIFDAAVSGWVLEHLGDPGPGLRELARVMIPRGKLLLMTTEDTIAGAACGRLWHCRTYNRSQLKGEAERSGFQWRREYWFSRLHSFLGMGGIIVELMRS